MRDLQKLNVTQQIKEVSASSPKSQISAPGAMSKSFQPVNSLFPKLKLDHDMKPDTLKIVSPRPLRAAENKDFLTASPRPGKEIQGTGSSSFRKFSNNKTNDNVSQKSDLILKKEPESIKTDDFKLDNQPNLQPNLSWNSILFMGKAPENPDSK